MAEQAGIESSPAAAPAILSSFVMDQREITITRDFNAPRELVFKVWTDPKHVAQWWGPNGFTTPACEIDLQPGGHFQLQMLGPDGNMYPCKGVIREVTPPERIVYVGISEDGPACGSGLPPRSTVTVTFDEHDGKTKLTIHTVLESIAARAAAAEEGFNIGWGQSLERLAEHLAKA